MPYHQLLAGNPGVQLTTVHTMMYSLSVIGLWLFMLCSAALGFSCVDVYCLWNLDVSSNGRGMQVFTLHNQ